MSDLKNSVAFLFFFLLLIFGVAQVRYVEQNLLNFSPVFFVLVTLAVVTGLLVRPSRRLTIYVFLMGWAAVYALTWFFYWRTNSQGTIQLHIIQVMLVTISAGLAFDVGRQIAQVTDLVRGLTARTYPNRTMDLAAAEDRISAELTRSRRYHHPLSLLLVEVGRISGRNVEEHPALQRDILAELAAAKVGQIINERARETDLIMRDDQGRFVILCPETAYENSISLARRIEESVSTIMGATIQWGSAFFPSEALTFEDLVQQAEARLDGPITPPAEVYGEEPEGMREKSRR